MSYTLDQWSRTADTNVFNVPDGAPNGWFGANINEWGREVMAVVRDWYDDPEWLSVTEDLVTRSPKTVNQIDSSSFRVVGCDATAYYTAGRRVRFLPSGNEAHVKSSVFTAGNTEVEIYGTNVPASINQDGALVYFAKSIDRGAFVSQPAVGDVKLTATLPSAAATGGWLECDGAEYLVATYPELAAALGADGSGNGYYDAHPDLGAPAFNKFRVPDLAGRVPIGFWDAAHPGPAEPDGDYNYVTGTTADTWGGEKKHQLTEAELPSHDHGFLTDGDHTHTLDRDNSPGNQDYTISNGTTLPDSTGSGGVNNAGDHNHSFVAVGSDTPHENRPKYAVMGYVIYSGRA